MPVENASFIHRVVSALSYPMVVMVMAMITVLILAGYVLPQFKPLFEELGAELPLATLQGFPFHWKTGADQLLLVSLGYVGLLFAAYMRDPTSSFIPMQTRIAEQDAFNRWNSLMRRRGKTAHLLERHDLDLLALDSDPARAARGLRARGAVRGRSAGQRQV